MNILVLTSIYPEPDDEKKAGVTPVVHDFTKVWVTQGHNVVVIHNANRYPLLLHMLPQSLKQKINSTVGMVLPASDQDKDLLSVKDGVTIARFPMLKVIPKGRFTDGSIIKQFEKIISYLEKNQFVTQVVIGHWENPQIPLLSMMKKKFACRTAIVFHTFLYIRQPSCKKWVFDYLKDIDILGCRSKTMAAELKKMIRLAYNPFVCYSGVPDEYVDRLVSQRGEKFTGGNLRAFVYAGRYTRQKNVGSIIQALNRIYPDNDFGFDIIGIDNSVTELSALVSSMSLGEQVRFHGRKPRTEVIRLMKDSQCFIMISENEAFGLVYLEAMACGCITIGSRGEGVDGVIEHGVNGFLCKAGDTNELATLLAEINRLSQDRKEEISNNAVKTAIRFRESVVAMDYLQNVCGKMESGN